MAYPSRLRLLVVDDHAAYRRELVKVLARQPDFEVVAQASNGAEAVLAARGLRAEGLDLVLMDIDMPVLEGMAATAEINVLYPDLPVVMLTVSTLDRDLFGALRAGAIGYLSKNLAPGVLVRILRDFKQSGSLPMSRQMAAKMLGYFQQRERGLQRRVRDAHGTDARLTQRETQVLAMIATGAHDREIAAALLVAETTVKTHVQHVLRKLHARNRAEAAARYQSGDREYSRSAQLDRVV
jgi:DNA-binding NarL/FixJ family response regulator